MGRKLETNRRTLLADARQELCDAAEDLFYAAKLFRAAGDSSTAADVAALAERVLLDANMAGRPS
jgi:hypothetical protein